VVLVGHHRAEVRIVDAGAEGERRRKGGDPLDELVVHGAIDEQP
jgi:hypothetical protein